LPVFQNRLRDAQGVPDLQQRVALLEQILADARSSLSPTHYFVIEVLTELSTAYEAMAKACQVLQLLLVIITILLIIMKKEERSLER
jgi:hypothetical protein